MNNEKIFKEVGDKIIALATRGVQPWEQGWTEHSLRADFERLPAAEHIINSTGAHFNIVPDEHAGYHFGRDNLRTPDPRSFKSQTCYYSTAFHELGHWTGHVERLFRPTLYNGSFDPTNYAVEEMIAEFTSANILGVIGLDDTDRQAAYITSFANDVADMGAVRYAQAEASKAANFILEKAQ